MEEHPPPESLLSYLDGLEGAQDAERIRRHLEACPACREAAENIQYLDDKVKEGALFIPPFPEGEVPGLLAEAMDVKAASLLAKNVPAKPAYAPGRLPAYGKRRFTLRKAALALAAGVLLVLNLFLFSETRPPIPLKTEIHPLILYPTRGQGEPDSLYFDMTLGAPAYLYILNLDATRELTCVFPFLSDSEADDFGLKGPFQPGKPMRIPPGEQAYGLKKGFGKQFFFLIPSRAPLEEAGLRGLMGELEKRFLEKGGDPEAVSRKIQGCLSVRYPGTRLIPLEPGNP